MEKVCNVLLRRVLLLVFSQSTFCELAATTKFPKCAPKRGVACNLNVNYFHWLPTGLDRFYLLPPRNLLVFRALKTKLFQDFGTVFRDYEY